MDWSEAQQYADHVRQHGIAQFLNLFHRLKDRRNDHLLWGDEVEYMLVTFNQEKHEARLSLRALDMLQKLQEEEHAAETTGYALAVAALRGCGWV